MKGNAILIVGGGGTAVVSASARGLIQHTYMHYRDKVGTFYAAIGGMRGAVNEDITDVFAWAQSDPDKLNQLSWPSWPVFGTSRYKPKVEACKRLVEVFNAHNIEYVFLNGGNDTMEKAIILKDNGMRVVGIPKTVDNDLLVTHRCPGYASFAKHVALTTRALQGDLHASALQPDSTRGGRIKEDGAAQVLVVMGRDQGWGAAASVLAQKTYHVGGKQIDIGPHVILTKDGLFEPQAFVKRCEAAWKYNHRLLVVAAEGAYDGTTYVGNRLKVRTDEGLEFKLHKDPHKNISVTDGRLSMYLKLLLEAGIPFDETVYNKFKVRQEGPGYINRCDPEILSKPDYDDAIAVGAKAADLMFGGIDGVMVTLTARPGETDSTPFKTVAAPEKEDEIDSTKGSRNMVRPLSSLATEMENATSRDGMMVNQQMFRRYIEPWVDLGGPNRAQILCAEGFRHPVDPIFWTPEQRKLPPYT